MIITAFPSFWGTRTMVDAQGLEDGCITPLISMSGCRCFASSRLCRGIRRTHCRIGGLFLVSTQCFTKLVHPRLSLSANRSVLANNNRKNCCFCSGQLLTTILYRLPEPFSFGFWNLSTLSHACFYNSNCGKWPHLSPLKTTTDSDCVLIICTGTQGEAGFISALAIQWNPA